MKREQFIRLMKDVIIFDNVNDKMCIVKSSFIEPDEVKDDDELICLEFFMQNTDTIIPVSECENWTQFRVDAFMDDLSQGLINKLLLKKIMMLEVKLKNASAALK